MTQEFCHIDIVVPGLRRWLAENSHAQEQPVLRRWLARGEREENLPSQYQRLLLTLAGCTLASDQDVPIAPLAWAGEPIGALDTSCALDVGGASDSSGTLAADRWWLRADPVHLRADRDQLLLFALDEVEVSVADAQSLVRSLNDFYAADGLRFYAPDPYRWYLSLPTAPQIRNYDLAEVTGRSLTEFMPVGAQQRWWRTRLTEMQMLLHDHEVNRARSLRGLPIINGVWLWGGGTLPSLHKTWDQVWAIDPFVLGLARTISAANQTLPARFDAGALQLPNTARTLIVCDHLMRPSAENEQARWSRCCDDWLAPLYEYARTDARLTVRLVTDFGVAFSLRASHIRRFWRRAPNLRAWLGQE